MEHTVKVWSVFDRERLKKIYILKSNKGQFLIRTRTLLRDSLEVVPLDSWWSSETLELVASILIGEKAFEVIEPRRHHTVHEYTINNYKNKEK